MGPTTGVSYDEPAPNSFSFNSPYGACPTCNGLGVIEEFTESTIITDDSLSILQGGIAPLGDYRDTWIFREIDKVLSTFGNKVTTPLKEMKPEALDALLQGAE